MKIKCSQCGGDVAIEEDAALVRCPYCQTSLFLERDESVRHYLLQPQLERGGLNAQLRRHLTELDVKDELAVRRVEPLWLPTWQLQGEDGRVADLPAANPPLECMTVLDGAVGDLKSFDPQRAAAFGRELKISRLLEEALASGEDRPPRSWSLVHRPFYDLEYLCRGESHRACVDAVSGRVYMDAWPAAPQREKDGLMALLAAGAFAVFLLQSALLQPAGLALAGQLVSVPLLFLLGRVLLKRMNW